MLSSTFNRASRSPRTRRAVERLPLTRKVVGRFVAGERTPQAVNAVRGLTTAGLCVTIDVLGEDVTDLAGARHTVDTYMDLLQQMDWCGLAAGADVSVKLSALGQALRHTGERHATENAREICEAAAAVGATVTLDMEDHTTVDSTLSIGTELRKSFPWVGNVLQSNLERTDGDLADLAGTATRIRIVKGAYREPEDVARQVKADVDIAYARHIDLLMGSACYPMVATHDPRMLDHATASAAWHRRANQDWEAQMLYGIRTDLHHSVHAHGHTMRVYIPYGTDWYGYFMRRLAERPANVAFFLRALANR